MQIRGVNVDTTPPPSLFSCAAHVLLVTLSYMHHVHVLEHLTD